MAPVQDTPIQQSHPSREQSFSFDRKSGGDLAFEQRSQAAIAQKMRAAWSYLCQLQAEVSVAIAGGHVAAARSIALEAASVASSIDSIARHIPLMLVGSGGRGGGGMFIPANLASIEENGSDASAQSYIPALSPSAPSAPVEVSSAPAPAAPSTSAPVAVPSVTELMTLARGGLEIAQQVVSSAATIPFFTPQDSSAINLSLEQVKAAIIHVEAIMAAISVNIDSSAPQASSGHIDVST